MTNTDLARLGKETATVIWLTRPSWRAAIKSRSPIDTFEAWRVRMGRTFPELESLGSHFHELHGLSIDVYIRAIYDEANKLAAKTSVLLLHGLFDRWVVVLDGSPHLAWNGSRWVRHKDGMPAGDVQVSNFSSQVAAADYAESIGFVVCDK